MEQDVGIAVPYSPEITGDQYASQPQVFALGQLMNVVSVADAQIHAVQR